ncbi:deoxyribose-phosphate aldolase [Thermogladius sp. 4427co]|uniref:deoxyribose-phosphate aldolase n=1 Tax=Thermogladius sp. 4427co TaxID=3450718 RepID=UPI003F7AB15C
MSRLMEYLNRISSSELASYIDHTMLKPQADYKQLEKYIGDCKRYGFKALVIPLSLVPKAIEISGKSVRIATVVGFPLGNTSTRSKIAEISEASELGVKEIDAVMNINAFKSGDYGYVLGELKNIVREARDRGIEVVKIIIETGLLTDEEKIKAAKLVLESGADFVKTSTGFLGEGATVYDVRLLYNAVEGKIGVKAAGGIRHVLDALAMIDAGASRIGTSTGDKIMEEFDRLKKGLL